MPRRTPIIIQLQLPDWSPRRWLTIGIIATLLGGAVALAGVMWTPFAGGEKLSSAKMNANFQAMADAIDKGVPLPHLVLDQGNVDLGLFLGGTWVFSAAVKAPFDLSMVTPVAVYFDGPNCTGNTYSSPFGTYTNMAFNTALGTIFVPSGPIQKNVPIVSFNQQGYGCNGTALMLTVFPIKDSKVPNILLGGAPTSILMM